MENIKTIVKNKEWQTLRLKLKGTWKDKKNVNKNLIIFNNYLGNWEDERKLRRVQNYLAALRSIDNRYPNIKKMRDKIKKHREKENE